MWGWCSKAYQHSSSFHTIPVNMQSELFLSFFFFFLNCMTQKYIQGKNQQFHSGIHLKSMIENCWEFYVMSHRCRVSMPMPAGFPWQWGLSAKVIVHTILPPSPAVLWIELGGRSKWLPSNFWYHDVMCTAPILCQCHSDKACSHFSIPMMKLVPCLISIYTWKSQLYERLGLPNHQHRSASIWSCDKHRSIDTLVDSHSECLVTPNRKT